MVDDVKSSLDCGMEGIVMKVAPSRHLITGATGRSVERATEFSIEAAKYAHGQDPRVSFFPIDATRARSTTTYAQSSESPTKATSTPSGSSTRSGYSLRTRSNGSFGASRERLDVLLEIHFHMDYGLGGASSFIAAASGASVIQATSADSANEPATPLEETVLGLLTLYGNDVGIHTESLTPLARLVAELSDVPQPSNRPVSCARGFDVESGIITSWVRNVRDIVDRSHALPPRAGRADRSQPSLAEKRLLDQDDLRAIVDTVRSA